MDKPTKGSESNTLKFCSTDRFISLSWVFLKNSLESIV